MTSKAPVPAPRRGRLSAKVFFVMLVGLLAGAVIEAVGRLDGGTALQPYRDWRHQWTGYGEALPTVGVVWLVGGVWVLWSWLARKREEASFVRKYGKHDGAE